MAVGAFDFGFDAGFLIDDVVYHIVVERAGRSGAHPDGLDYPFVLPSIDIRGLFDDLYLNHRQDVALPLRVKWVYGFSRYFVEGDYIPEPPDGYTPVHTADLEIVDANDATVFDTRQATHYAAEDFGTYRRVHEWTFGLISLRVTQNTAYEDTEDIVVYPDYIEPERGVLDERCSEVHPLSVLSVSVDDEVMRNHLILESGFNTELVVDQPVRGVRRVNRITFSAAPGSGLGRFPNCQEPDLLLRRVNGIGPDETGNLKIATDLCHYARQPMQQIGQFLRPVAATIRIGNDCVPCADCDDDLRVYAGLKNLESDIIRANSDLGASIAAAASDFSRFEDLASCVRLQRMSLVGRAHNGNMIEVGVAICNPTDACLRNVELTLSIAVNNPDPVDCIDPFTLPDCAVVVSGAAGMERGSLSEVSEGIYSLYWDHHNPGRTLTARFRIVVDCVGDATSVTIGASAASDGIPLPSAEAPQSVTATIALNSGC